ncbi:hypothetical protein [Brachybacterium subflavum]|uniref:hypothetical protein n=1 Tax=Brachybacterium subflavum TaxID=2585206 RepID=UPI00126674BC|nr:hypothetical protein [Brachybacterium subflavum]
MSDHLPPLGPAGRPISGPAGRATAGPGAAGAAPAAVAARAIVGTRRLVLADALVGIALTLVLAVPVAATLVLDIWGDRLSGDSTGSAYDGFDVLLGWVAVNLLALVLAALLAIAALVLDILVAVRSLELTTGRLGAVVRGGRRLLFALLGACGIVTTPVLGLLSLVPAPVLGPGTATNSMLLVLMGLAFAVPIMCRLLMIAFSHELTILGLIPPPPHLRQITPGPRR